MKINYQNTKLDQVAGQVEQFPQTHLPQIVISGKSNVGKSSLINALCNNKNLARTSQSPGKTQQVIFYLIDGAFYLVDLPGYGYAKVAKKNQIKFSNLTNRYLETTEISLLIQLLDIRHKPSQDDLDMLEWLGHSNIPYVVVLTKADKLKKTKIKPQVDLIKSHLSQELQEDFRPIISSSLKKTGLDQLKSTIAAVINPELL